MLRARPNGPRAATPRPRLAGIGLLVGLTLLVAAALPGLAQAQAACTISWDGQLSARWFEFQPNGPGPGDDITNWSPERWPDGTDDVCFPSGSVASTTQVTTNTPAMRSFNISQGATLSITDVQLIVSEDSSNAGTLNMSGPVPVTISDGNAADRERLTNTSTGLVHFTAGGPAGIRSLKGDLLNQGTIDVDNPGASLERGGAGSPAVAVLTNQGTVDISPGNTLRSIFSTFVHGPDSVITGGGTMNMDQERFEISGNSQIVAPTDVNMTNGTLAGTAGSAATGNFDIHGAFAGGGPSNLEGTLPAGITVDVEGVTLIAAPDDTTVNAGRINLNGPGAELKVNPNDSNLDSTSKLTNTGMIEFTAGGSSGLRLITGNLVNQGTILVNNPDASFQFPGGTNTPPKLTNLGTLSVSTGNAIRAISNAIVVNGPSGLINGAGTVNVGANRFEVAGGSQISSTTDVNLGGGTTLAFVSPAAGTSGNVDATSGTIPLSGSVPSSFGIDVTSSALKSSTGFTNAGTIDLIGGNAEIRTEDGNPATVETLTNTGTIAYSGTGGNNFIAGDLLNQGTINITHPSARFQQRDESRPPRFTNTAAGTVTIAAGASLALLPGFAQDFINAGTVQVNGLLAPIGYTQTGGTTTLVSSAPGNSIGLSPSGALALQGGTLRGTGNVAGGPVQNIGGRVAPGSSPGVLAFNDNYSQGAGGTLAAEISGAGPGTGYDQLVVGGTAALGGTLDVTTSGFSPVTGQAFTILDAPAPPAAPTVSGTFASVQQHGGPNYTVRYNPTDVTLTVQAPPAPAAPTLTGSSPVSGSNANAPKIIGSAQAGTTVRLFENATCSGSPVATGSAAALASPGIAVSVADNSTAIFWATATNANGTSPCSSTSVTYAEVSPAAVGAAEITKGPKRRTRSRRAQFKFSADGAVSFECKLDRKPFSDCSSPLTLKRLKRGKHTFKVRASGAGGDTGESDTHRWKVTKPRKHR